MPSSLLCPHTFITQISHLSLFSFPSLLHYVALKGFLVCVWCVRPPSELSREPGEQASVGTSGRGCPLLRQSGRKVKCSSRCCPHFPNRGEARHGLEGNSSHWDHWVSSCGWGRHVYRLTNLHHKLTMHLSLFPFYKWENWGPLWCSFLYTLVKAKSSFTIQGFPLQIPLSFLPCGLSGHFIFCLISWKIQR